MVKSDDVEWIMCSSSNDKKEDWMDAIVKVKGMASVMSTDLAELEGEVTLA